MPNNHKRFREFKKLVKTHCPHAEFKMNGSDHIVALLSHHGSTACLTVSNTPSTRYADTIVRRELRHALNALGLPPDGVAEK